MLITHDIPTLCVQRDTNDKSSVAQLENEECDYSKTLSFIHAHEKCCATDVCVLKIIYSSIVLKLKIGTNGRYSIVNY